MHLPILKTIAGGDRPVLDGVRVKGTRFQLFSRKHLLDQTRTKLMLATVLSFAFAAMPILIWWFLSERSGNVGAAQGTPSMLPAAMAPTSVIFDTHVLPITKRDAVAFNAARAIDITTTAAARPFHIDNADADNAHYAAALQCLAQAIYYEAASENEEGQRAVAQVVLNRVRSPMFPNTVCGVVYQGAERTDGCQFSFTCDGSLMRAPIARFFGRSRRIAAAALAGAVEPLVGNATHYHANYVVPIWASSLVKVTTINSHIFYLMRGSLGAPVAYNVRYNLAMEMLPALSPDDIAPEEATLDGVRGGEDIDARRAPPRTDLRAEIVAGNLITETSSAFWQPPSVLREDEGRGILQADKRAKLIVDDTVRTPDQHP